MPGPKLSEVADHIIASVANGVPAALAAQAAGVSERTFYEWVQRGQGKHARRKATAEYVEFAQAINRARGRAVERHQLVLTKAAYGGVVRREVKRIVVNDEGVREDLVEREFYPPDVRALQWWLERRVPQFYGAVVAKDAESAAGAETMPPAAAERDPGDVHGELASLIDRYVAAEGEGGSAPAGVQPPGGD